MLLVGWRYKERKQIAQIYIAELLKLSVWAETKLRFDAYLFQANKNRK